MCPAMENGNYGLNIFNTSILCCLYQSDVVHFIDVQHKVIVTSWEIKALSPAANGAMDHNTVLPY